MDNLYQLYFTARNNCLKMMKDRGYEVPSGQFAITYDQFKISYKKKKMDITDVYDNEKNPVYVKILESTRQFSIKKDKTEVFEDAHKYFKSKGKMPYSF